MQLKERLNNPLLANIASMGLVQVANYAIPILIIPYVVRALGVDAFGAASYAQNIAAYLTLLVTYGFDYSATQEIAIHKEDAEKVRQIFWRVISAKLLLFAATLAVLCALYLLLPRAKADPASFFYAGLINLGFALFPAWYFQGTERMAKMALFNFGVKSVGALLTIALVRSPGDYRLYVLSLSAAQVVDRKSVV